MPFAAYIVCALVSLPSGEQIGSPVAHRSMVLARYKRPMKIGGAEIPFPTRNLLDGFPKSAMAATWSATSAGIGPAMPAADLKAAGTTSSVVYAITAAPSEYPPSTILVLGQFAAMYLR